MHSIRITSLFFLSLIVLISCQDEPPIGSTVDENQALVRSGNGPETVENQYIVVLKPGVNAKELAQANGLTAFRTYEHALNGFAVTVSNENALNGLRNNPNVLYIEPDLKMKAYAQTVPTGIKRIQANSSSTPSGTSPDVDIAIIDSGIDQDHPDLNVVGGVHFWTQTTGRPRDRGPKQDNNYDDDFGHGTHVSGTVAAKNNNIGVVGVVPGAKLWGVKVLDASGSGYLSDIINGIDWVTANADVIEVANMSLGGIGFSNAYQTAIANSVAQGVVYIVAAGNESRDVFGLDGQYGTGDEVVPAAYPEVAAISAYVDTDGQAGGNGGSSSYGADDTFASFSNYSATDHSNNPVNSSGGAIDLILPGVNIYSTYPGGYSTSSGTSMAAPHAAGLAAKYIIDNGRANNASEVYAIRQALIDGGIGMFSSNGLAQDNDPDNNNENLGWAGTSGPQPPVALAGSDVTVSDGDGGGTEQVTVDGSNSYDPDGGTLTYEWSLNGSVVATSAQYTGTYNAGSSYTLTLKVTDDENETASDDVVITVDQNQAPVADAGNNQTVTDGDDNGSESVTLDASGSSDVDGTIASYVWTEGGSTLGSGESINTTLSVGSHSITLTVTDNAGATSTDQLTVTVNQPSEELSISSISPYGGDVGSTVNVTISGSGFQNGASLSLSGGSGPTPDISNVSVVNSTSITATITIGNGGPPRNREWDVTVTNTDGNSVTVNAGFTVYP